MKSFASLVRPLVFAGSRLEDGGRRRKRYAVLADTQRRSKTFAACLAGCPTSACAASRSLGFGAATVLCLVLFPESVKHACSTAKTVPVPSASVSSAAVSICSEVYLLSGIRRVWPAGRTGPPFLAGPLSLVCTSTC